MNILMIIDPSETGYVGTIRKMLQGHNIMSLPKNPTYLDDIDQFIKKILKARGLKIHAVVTSNIQYLRLLVREEFSAELGKSETEKILHLYEGSVFKREIRNYTTKETYTLPVLSIPALRSTRFKTYGKFVIDRYLRKLYDPSFPFAPELEWESVNAATLHNKQLEEIIAEMDDALLIGVDIETTLDEFSQEWESIVDYDGVNMQGIGYIGQPKTKSGTKAKRKAYLVPRMTCVGYTVIHKDLTSKTYVLGMDSLDAVYIMRAFNKTEAPKAMQNGRYDSMYFLRYAAPLKNWTVDTFLMMHSWYAELPRSLDFISGFMLRDHMYWKDESGVHLHLYNAKDCHATAWAALFMWLEMPDWAKANYVENFPKIWPSLQCGAEGFRVDAKEHEVVKAKYEEQLAEASEVMQKRSGVSHFNARSWQHVEKLLKAVGFRQKGTDAKTLQKFREGNSYWDVLGEAIIEVRKNSKAVSTYMNISYFSGRLLYELDPGGTDTGRFASKASSFWCGTQVQNIPLYARSMYIADEGYVLCAIDNGQSESRCTAYISGDENLINTVEDERDFHKVNASLFFGLDYDHITKAIRTVAKRVNHGANYNMGPNVLIETMGTRALIESKHLLGLPASYSVHDVAVYLLGRFEKAYPKIKTDYYEAVIDEIAKTNKLVGPTGWTRWCFGDPTESKMQLNSYVAHPPQSLSVKMINEAFYKTWAKLQLRENVIRLKAQVHDEIIFQVKPENLDYAVKTVSELMEAPVQVYGKTLIIPNDPIVGKQRWSELKD